MYPVSLQTGAFGSLWARRSKPRTVKHCRPAALNAWRLPRVFRRFGASLLKNRTPRRAEIVACLSETGSHSGLRRLEKGSRIVELLVPDFAVDLEDAVVILEHVVGDRTRERVLRIGVDVHFDDAIAEGLANLMQTGFPIPRETPDRTRHLSRTSSSPLVGL